MTRARAYGALAALIALTAGSACLAAPPADIPIAASHIYPESLSAGADGTLYIGSIKGIVFRKLPGETEASPWITPDASNGILSLLGVLTDPATNTLWLCSAPNPFRTPPATGISALKALDLATGALKASYDFPAPAAACNDIAIAPDGTVFATDTPNGRILSLKPGDMALSVFAADPALRGIDGIAFDDVGTLFINNVIANTLQRIERGTDGSYAGATTLILSQPVKGPDGFRLLSGKTFLLAEGPGGRIDTVTIDGDRATVTPVKTGLNSSPAVTHFGGVGYALEGKIGYLVDPKLKGQDPDPFVIRAFALE